MIIFSNIMTSDMVADRGVTRDSHKIDIDGDKHVAKVGTEKQSVDKEEIEPLLLGLVADR